ncbi:gp83-like protein [Phenacoccus solenopsis nudivirus]|nr:gp83-like protein [Phenacoccus solenopsis nudivirus]
MTKMDTSSIVSHAITQIDEGPKKGSLIYYIKMFEIPNTNDLKRLYVELTTTNKLNQVVSLMDSQGRDVKRRGFKLFTLAYTLLVQSYKVSTDSNKSGTKRRHSVSSNESDAGEKSDYNNDQEPTTNGTVEESDTTTTTKKLKLANDAGTVTAFEQTKSKGETAQTSKTHLRVASIPNAFMECNSIPVMNAVALFGLYESRSNTALMGKIFVMIHRREFNNVRELCELIDRPLQALVQSVKHIDDSAYVKTINAEHRLDFVKSIFRTSVILRERTLSVFISDLDFKTYIDFIDSTIETTSTSNITVYPYHGAFLKWSIRCVIPSFKKSKLKQMLERFNVNPKDTIKDLLADLYASLREEEENNQQEKIKKCKVDQFDSTKIYYVFNKGSNHFYLDIYPAYKTINDVDYQLLMYKSCVYDVVSVDGKACVRDTWPERLNRVDLPKITLEEKNGQELNDIDSNQTVGVSWMENDLSYYRTFILKKPKSFTSSS